MLYIYLLILIIGFSFLSTIKNVRKHFVFLFSLIVYLVYLVLGPIDAIENDDYEKLGGFFYYYFEDGLLIYSLAMASYTITYLLSYRFIESKEVATCGVESSRVFNPKSKVYTYVLFAVVSFVVFQNADYSGEHSVDSSYNYILFFADSLIIAFAILYYEKKSFPLLNVIVGVTIIYFLILGFRYRIILLLLAGFYNMLWNNKINIFNILKVLLFIVFSSYIINFISLNRDDFSRADFDNITYSTESPYELSPYGFLMQQTENYSTDFNVLKYFEESSVNHDLGFSMFGHIVIRITPSFVYTNNTKPIIPQQEIIKNCFTTIAGYESGSAVTNIFQYYIAYGIYGVVFFMGLIGYILARMSKRLDISVPRNRIIIIITAMILFQEITRGFLPQVFTLFIYLYLPFRLFYKRIKP